MLGLIRTFAKTWPARVLFGVLVAAFGLWGVAGRLHDQSNDTAVAHVGNSRIEAEELQRGIQQRIAQLQQRNGASFQPSPAERQQIADELVQQLVFQHLVDLELRHLGVVVPDSAIRDAVFSLAAFKGPGGRFDHATMQNVLARNSMTEDSFIALVREDLGRQQFVGAVTAGAAAPRIMLRELFTFTRQLRSVAAVFFPTAAATGVPAPSDADLQRFWRNNPGLYQTPEYRRVKLIVLSADTLASDMTVSADDIKRYYELDRAEYVKPELRTLEIVTAQSQAQAASIATAWQQGVDWQAVQALATRIGATPLELPNARQREVPDPVLAGAAFAAQPGVVSQPLKGSFNWYVFKVAKVTPALNTTLVQASTEIRHKIGVLKAADVMDDHVNKLEDALAGGGALDTLPQGLGVAAAEGTLDAQGNARDGTRAPIPGWPALRQAIIATAFHEQANQPPQLVQFAADKDHSAGAWYAVTVDSVSKPSAIPYAQVATRVRQDWTDDQKRRIEEAAAAQLLTKVKGGATMAVAARQAGLSVVMLPPIPRPFQHNTIPPGVPQALVAPLFGMKQGEATMVNTNAGFMVAQLTAIVDPPLSSDPIGSSQLKAELTQSLTSDLTDTLLDALQQRYKVTLNTALISRVSQP